MTKEERKEYSHNRYLLHHEEIDARNREWRRKHPEKQRGYQRKKNYGISQEEYDALLLAQDGKCAVCGREDSGQKRNGEYCQMLVDHDHETGKVRGLLCHDCNVALGWLESLEANGKEKLLRDYLQKHR
jgi:hypothetical protein